MEAPYKSHLLLQLLLITLTSSYTVNSFAEIHGTLTAMSNYIGRGYSKSNNEFSYLANIDYQHESGLYFGSTATHVNFGDNTLDNEARVEITPYLGWSYHLNKQWRLDAQWSRYLYDGNIFGQKSDYNEFYLFLHYNDIFSASVSFSEDYYHRGHTSGNYELTGRYPITDFLQFSAGAGYSQTNEVLEYDYLYWNAGVTCFYKFFSLDLRYAEGFETVTDTSLAESHEQGYFPHALKPTFLFSVSVGF